MSFNLRYGDADDGRHRWTHRKELAVERIRHFDPDLLGLQECLHGEQAEFVQAQLPDYGFFARQRGSVENPDAEMAPILFRRSKFELIESGYFWLSETPNVVGSISWDSACTRITMWAYLRCKRRPNQTLTFVNTHLDYRPGPAYKGAKVLRAQLDALGSSAPCIVTGDFNAEKDSPVYQLLVGNRDQGPNRFYDTFRAVNDEAADQGTYHGFGRQNPMPAIDWILASEHFETIEAGIDRYRSDALYPSDHCPIFAVLKRIPQNRGNATVDGC